MIFDLDGVIADTHPIHRQAWRQALLERGRQVAEEELDFILEGRKRDEILRYFLGDLPAVEVSACGQRKDALFQQSVAGLRAIPGVAALLQQFHSARVPTAVATSASRDRTRRILQRLGLSNCFSAVVTAADVAESKPDPSIFHLAANCLHLMPHQLLVAEDSVAGVRAATSAGMKCLGIARGPLALTLCEEGADFVVPDFSGMSLARLRDFFQAPRPKAKLPSGLSEEAHQGIT